MDFIKKLVSFLPFMHKEEMKEYFFALSIGQETLDAALWELSGKHLHVLNTSSAAYSSLDEIAGATDTLLDNVLGSLEVEPQKILFGVLDSWLSEEDLKEEYLRLLRNLVKELELTPMAYVATSAALLHFLENKEGVPATAILVGFEKHHLTITVSRAGKLDGSKMIKRSENPGADIEKILLTFTNVETLPSKILLYGKGEEKMAKMKDELLSFSWMSNLSFLHFPKIDILEEDLEVKSVCLAGAKEINPDVVFEVSHAVTPPSVKKMPPGFAEEESQGSKASGKEVSFVVGDISQKPTESEAKSEEEVETENTEKSVESRQTMAETAVAEVGGERSPLEVEDFVSQQYDKPKFLLPLTVLASFLRRFKLPLNFRSIPALVAIILVVVLALAYLFLPHAKVKIFVEPQVLEKDTQVTADPKAKSVDEDAKIIPGQIVETEVSGSGKGDATGKKDVGDPAKGTVIIYNKTFDTVSLSKGTQITSKDGVKFTIDASVPNIASASSSVSGIQFGKPDSSPTVTAITVGADGNLASGTEFTIAGYSSDKLSAVASGNFSGGTSKQVTVVSAEDQQKLLALVAGDLRKQAQQKLQDNLKDKKILEEGLSEDIKTKSFTKKVGDQASDFSLSLDIKYTGTAFDDKDLRSIVSKLVSTDVPAGFELNLAETETQADVSKLEKDGRLIFLARFKAKLTPKLDINKIKSRIKGKTPSQASDILKGQEHILGSEIIIMPNLPAFLQRLPFFGKNIDIEVGLK